MENQQSREIYVSDNEDEPVKSVNQPLDFTEFCQCDWTREDMSTSLVSSPTITVHDLFTQREMKTINENFIKEAIEAKRGNEVTLIDGDCLTAGYEKFISQNNQVSLWMY